MKSGRQEISAPIQASISAPAGLVQRARSDPKTLSATDVMHLQRAIGNQAVAHLLYGQPQRPETSAVTARGQSTGLRVGPVDDHYEQEADRMAQRVAQEAGRTGAAPRSMPGRAATVQRVERPQVGPEGGAVDDDLARQIHMVGSGQAVPGAVSSAFQAATGSDVSGVQVISNTTSHTIARSGPKPRPTKTRSSWARINRPMTSS